jgi:F420-non-reducing hydrogenase iron-sulfur subunit
MSHAETALKSDVFEPKIIVFACNWCSYAGADLAGVSRLPYPSNIRIIRVMCSGRVDPAFVLKAFLKGADGVIVAGCHPGDCHYLEGNLRAKERIDNMVEALKLLGWEVDRFRLEWISASEGKRFAQIMTEFTEKIRELGPIKIIHDSE